MASEFVSFSSAVRAVADEARRMGLAVPGFRSPPGMAGVDRTIRRRHGDVIVSVRLRGRPFADVVADVVEGVLVVNCVPRAQDLRVRRRLLAAVEATMTPAAGGTAGRAASGPRSVGDGPGTLGHRARVA